MIWLSELCYYYDPHAPAALDKVSFSIERGCVFGLLGPNGAGKTSLISLLAGLLKPQGGSISIDGESLAAWRARRPSAIALVPQDYAFYPMLTVTENLSFFAGVQGLSSQQRKRNCSDAVAFACLESVASRRAGELSGGLRRRLNLAIALTGAPDVLLLDEPTVGVDPQSRHFLLEAVKRFAATGHTVLYASHYMEEVEAICSGLAIMDHGKLLKVGTLAEIKGAETSVLTLAFARPLSEALIADLRARYPCMEAADQVVRVPSLATDEIAFLLSTLSAAGLTPQHMEYGTPNLEQVFMQLTHHSLRE